MKAIISSLILVLAMPVLAQSKKKPVDICEKAAWEVVNPFFAKYTEKRISEMKADLENGDEFDESDAPGGLSLESVEDNTYLFGWGEMQECSCGVEVDTKKSSDGKSCNADVNVETQSCECG
jgi:hypothetical protein